MGPEWLWGKKEEVEAERLSPPCPFSSRHMPGPAESRGWQEAETGKAGLREPTVAVGGH